MRPPRRQSRWLLFVVLAIVVLMGGGGVARVQLALFTSEAKYDEKPQPQGTSPPRPPLRSRVVCTGDNTTLPGKMFGINIVNRSCLYTDVLLRDGKWYFLTDDTDQLLPEVSLASKPILIGKRSFKKQYPAAYSEIQWGYRWRPGITTNSTHAVTLGGLTTMYSPEVAPWNYAHTLFNELFPLFWGMTELNEVTTRIRIVVYGALYNQPFQPDRSKWLPQNNAFPSFSTKPPTWEQTLGRRCGAAGCLIKKLLVGSGTRTWAYVTKSYTSPGTAELWQAFRNHIKTTLNVTRTTSTAPNRTLKMLICNKKSDSTDTKRGILNTDEVASWVSSLGNIEATRVALSNMPIKEQTQTMLDADIYMCNEGTMGTAFFLMEPGSVWISVMNIFRRTNSYDLYRPYSQKHFFWNTGGNIDWFPPAITWVKALHYDRYLRHEAVMDTSKGNFRNYLPNWSVTLNKTRLVPLVKQGVEFLRSGKTVTDSDNHSVMGRMCAQIMNKLGTSKDQIQHLFTSIKCMYGMSWFCEYLVNGDPVHRNNHPKWKKGCGSRPSLASLSISDPRDAWLVEEGIQEEPRAFDCPQPPLAPHPCQSSPGHPCCQKPNPDNAQGST